MIQFLINIYYLLSARMLILSLALTLFFSNTVNADSSMKTNINEVTDLFKKNIDDKADLELLLENSKQEAIGGIEKKSSFSAIGRSETDALSEAGRLNSIHANDLESAGREERESEKNRYLDSLYIDHSDAKIVNHKKDMDIIADKSAELMTRLKEQLDDLGIDCKTVKGNREIEPEYYIDIKKRHEKDTIYEQKICEELRNRYSCSDELTLKCQRTGKAYGQWQDRRIRFNGHTLHWEKMNWGYALHWKRKRWGWHIHSHHPGGFFFSPSESPWRNNPAAIIADARAYIANHLQVPIEQIGEYVEFPAAGRGIGNIGGVGCRWRVVWDEYEFGYKYRDSYDICEQWSEDWNQRCSLQW